MLDEGTDDRGRPPRSRSPSRRWGPRSRRSCGWDGVYVGFQCLTDDLAATLDLAVDILLNPTFPEAEWQRVHGQTLAALQAERDSAEARAYRAFSQALYRTEHPYRFPLAGTEETRRRHHGGRTCERSTTGSWSRPGRRSSSPATSTRGSGRRAGPAAGRLARVPRHRPIRLADPDVAAAPRILLLDRPGAPQAVVRAGHLGIARLDPAFDHMLVLNQILGGQFTSRLNDEAPRGARVHLRRAQPASSAGGPPGPSRSARRSRATGSPRRSTTSATSSRRSWPAGLPPRTSWTTPAGRSSRDSPATSRPRRHS